MPDYFYAVFFIILAKTEPFVKRFLPISMQIYTKATDMPRKPPSLPYPCVRKQSHKKTTV